MANTYVNKQTGEKVKIVKEESAFYTLDDGVKIKKETFSKRYDQSGEIDPMEFLNPTSALENMAQQIQQVDPNQVVNEPEHSTRIKMKPSEVLADNSREQINPVDNTDGGIQISEAKRKQMIDEYNLKKELGEPNLTAPSFTNESHQTEDGYIEYEMPNEGEGRIKQTSGPQPNTSQPTPQMDPLQMMFKMFKNNYEVKLTFEIDEKIADPAFIGMVMENVEGDAIEYYTKKILNKILKEPLKLKKEIYSQLELEIYGEDYVLEKKEKLEKEKLEKEEKEKEEKKDKITLPEVDPNKIKLSSEGVDPKKEKEENG